MKIAIISPRTETGNDILEVKFGRIYNIVKGLSKNHDILWIVVGGSEKKYDIPFNYKIIPNSKSLIPKTLDKYLKIKSIVEKNKPDMLLGTGDPLLCLLACKLAKNKKIKCVSELCDYYPSYKGKMFSNNSVQNYIIKNSSLVYCTSKTLAKYVSSKYHVKSMGIVNGFDVPVIDKPSVETMKKDLELSSNTIIYAGSLEKNRGVDLLVNAFPLVLKKVPDAELIIMGKGSDEENIRYLVKKLNLENNVIFLGHTTRDKLYVTLSTAKVGVIPNPLNPFTLYAFPIKLMDYISCNLNVVASDVGDLNDMAKECKQVILYKNGNVDDLSEKIIFALNSEKENCDDFLKKYSWDNLHKQLNDSISLA